MKNRFQPISCSFFQSFVPAVKSAEAVELGRGTIMQWEKPANGQHGSDLDRIQKRYHHGYLFPISQDIKSTFHHPLAAKGTETKSSWSHLHFEKLAKWCGTFPRFQRCSTRSRTKQKMCTKSVSLHLDTWRLTTIPSRFLFLLIVIGFSLHYRLRIFFFVVARSHQKFFFLVLFGLGSQIQ